MSSSNATKLQSAKHRSGPRAKNSSRRAKPIVVLRPTKGLSRKRAARGGIALKKEHCTESERNQIDRLLNKTGLEFIVDDLEDSQVEMAYLTIGDVKEIRAGRLSVDVFNDGKHKYTPKVQRLTATTITRDWSGNDDDDEGDDEGDDDNNYAFRGGETYVKCGGIHTQKILTTMRELERKADIWEGIRSICTPKNMYMASTVVHGSRDQSMSLPVKAQAALLSKLRKAGTDEKMTDILQPLAEKAVIATLKASNKDFGVDLREGHLLESINSPSPQYKAVENYLRRHLTSAASWLDKTLPSPQQHKGVQNYLWRLLTSALHG